MQRLRARVGKFRADRGAARWDTRSCGFRTQGTTERVPAPAVCVETGGVSSTNTESRSAVSASVKGRGTLASSSTIEREEVPSPCPGWLKMDIRNDKVEPGNSGFIGVGVILSRCTLLPEA